MSRRMKGSDITFRRLYLDHCLLLLQNKALGTGTVLPLAKVGELTLKCSNAMYHQTRKCLDQKQSTGKVF